MLNYATIALGGLRSLLIIGSGKILIYTGEKYSSVCKYNRDQICMRYRGKIAQSVIYL